MQDKHFDSYGNFPKTRLSRLNKFSYFTSWRIILPDCERHSGLHLFVCKSTDVQSSLFKKPCFFLIRPKYHGPLVVILKGFHFSFQITVLDVDLHLICSACFAQRNRGRCYPSNSHVFQLIKIGAAIYLFIYFILNNIYSGVPSSARLAWMEPWWKEKKQQKNNK